MSDYIPISCSFYDVLEAFATKQTEVEIEFLKGGISRKIVDKIQDFFVKDKVEYMKLKNGEEIRLDQLIQVNGEYLAHYTSC